VRDALGPGATRFAEPATWFVLVVAGLAVLVVALSYGPVRNLASRGQAMNASFEPFRLVNTYGAFGAVGRERYEVIVEGTDAEEVRPGTQWREYEFKGKPGDPRRMPPQVAPYHLRLDWLMWFLPLSRRYGESWFVPFLTRLLQGDRAILQLLRGDPFPDRPPVWIRARLFRYRFSSWAEWRRTGAWWTRSEAGPFVQPLRLRVVSGPISLREQ
jgi:hypothetical protein